MTEHQQSVCIIDDEKDITDMCFDFLKDEYSVRVFNSPIQALNTISEGYKPDVIISDMKMPKMSGLELAGELKNKNMNIPFAIMSGYADKNHTLEAFEKKISAFIEKPFNPNKLKYIISDLVEDSKQLAQLEVLVEKYRNLVLILRELKDQYADRFVAAENRIFELNEKLTSDPTATREYIKSFRSQDHLENEIESVTKLIKEIEQSEPGH